MRQRMPASYIRDKANLYREIHWIRTQKNNFPKITDKKGEKRLRMKHRKTKSFFVYLI